MVERDEQAEARYADHLERSRRQWNRWSDWYGLSEQDFAPIRERAIEAIAIDQGDDVLEVGCGPGVNLAHLASLVGERGSVTAVDYSPAMLDRARNRIEEHGLERVTLERADATTADLGGPYDAAVATLSLSVMPDIEAAVANVHGALVPGGELAVVDVRPFPSGVRRVFNPIVARLLRWYANWNRDGDVVGALEEGFEQCRVLETNMGGISYSAVARA